MQHDINLNIHWTIPDELWEKVVQVFRTMQYCDDSEKMPCWKGENIDLWYSVEPSGLQIAGTMPDGIWHVWYEELKHKLTDVLGYQIGEPEDGYEFKVYGER